MSCDDNKEAAAEARAKRRSLPVIKAEPPSATLHAPKEAPRYWASIDERNRAKAIALAGVNEFAPGADELGKYKMALQVIAIHGLLIHYTYFHVDCFAFGMFVLWIALVVTVWSGIDYYLKLLRALRPPDVRTAGKRAAV